MDSEQLQYYIDKERAHKQYLKDYLTKRRSVKFTCICGKITNDLDFNQHSRTKVHQKAIN